MQYKKRSHIVGRDDFLLKCNIVCKKHTADRALLALRGLLAPLQESFMSKWWCCDRKSRAACAQSFAPWQQATIEIMLAISLAVASYDGVILHAHPVRGESHNQRNTTGEVATTSPPFYSEPYRSHVLCVKA